MLKFSEGKRKVWGISRSHPKPQQCVMLPAASNPHIHPIKKKVATLLMEDYRI